MRIVDLMSENLILPEIIASDRDGVLAELADILARHTPRVLPRDFIRLRLLERERQAPTAVGEGIAIPHAKLPNFDQAVACFGRSQRGVPFGARDGRSTYLFLAILAPEGDPGLHLKALARASRLLMDRKFRSRIIEEADSTSMWKVLVEHDARLSQ